MKKKATRITVFLSVLFILASCLNQNSKDFEIRAGGLVRYTGTTAKVKIPSNVTAIGDGAFAGLSGLTSVTIPSIVKSIGEEAFSGCTGLTSITIGADVSFKDDPFDGDFVSVYDRSGKKAGTYVNRGGSWTAARSPLQNSNNLGFEIENGVLIKYTGAAAKVKIPSNVTVIGEKAFAGLVGLSNVTIPSGVMTIETEAFSGCTSLTSISIPSSVITIGEKAFSGCTGMTSVTIPSGVMIIHSEAFSGCTSLTSITIPSSVITIGEKAFSGCTSVTSVTIPSSVGDRLNGYWEPFSGCTSVTSVTIGADVSIELLCLFDDIPLFNRSVLARQLIDTSLSEQEKLQREKLEEKLAIEWQKQQEKQWAETYEGTLASVYINNGKQAGTYEKKGGTWIAPRSLHQNSNNLEFDVQDGVLVKYRGTEAEVKIPSNVTAIGEQAFSSIATRTNITIPSSVKSIKCGAFYECTGLSAVIIPSTVSSIEAFAFAGCTSLTSVTIPTSIKSIEVFAFTGCSLTSITIPSSVKFIKWGAFYRCESLTSVTIGAGVSLYEPTRGKYATIDWIEASFDGNLVSVYNRGGKKAGTYVKTGNGSWTKR